MQWEINSNSVEIQEMSFFFFSEDTVTNPAIWLVLYPVSIFLSLSSWVAEYMPPFVAIFHKYISFFGWADVGYYLKPINNLLILFYLSLKSLWFTGKYWFQNEFV